MDGGHLVWGWTFRCHPNGFHHVCCGYASRVDPAVHYLAFCLGAACHRDAANPESRTKSFPGAAVGILVMVGSRECLLHTMPGFQRMDGRVRNSLESVGRPFWHWSIWGSGVVQIFQRAHFVFDSVR